MPDQGKTRVVMAEPSERLTKRFMARYYHDGAWWIIMLDAYDEDDAEARCNRLSLQYDGEVICSFHPWLIWPMKIVCVTRNFFVAFWRGEWFS